MILEPEKQPLLLGLAATLAGLSLLLLWPPGAPWRDAVWAALLLVVALSLAWFERRMARGGQPLPPVRWVALGLTIVALAQLAWLLGRA